MLRFIVSQFRARRARTLALGFAIVAAATSFTLLASTTRTSSAQLRGTVRSNYRAAYDILVRPRSAATPLERTERLVRPNFLAGGFGGISFRQWHEIQGLPGVEVAAPVANIGFIMPGRAVLIPINELVTREPFQLYRIRQTWIANGGLSRYSAPTAYVYYTPRDRFALIGDYWVETGPAVGRPLASCYGFVASGLGQPQSPFPPLAARDHLSCFPTARHRARGSTQTVNWFTPPSTGFVGTAAQGFFPVFISAIDPIEEAKLVHLDRTLVSGRYLRRDDPLIPYRIWKLRGTQVPVLASSRTYVDEHLALTIERLRVPTGTDVPRALASGGPCFSADAACETGTVAPPKEASFRTGREFVQHLPGEVVARRSIPLSTIYGQLIHRRDPQSPVLPPGTFGSAVGYWTSSPVRYEIRGEDRVAPVPTRNPPAIWQSNASNFFTPPLINEDTQFRRLYQRLASNVYIGNVAQSHPLKVVGEFDPERLPSFSPLSKVPLETYYPPELLPADADSRRALRGQPYLPNQNLGGYVQQPPLLLTTMQHLRVFLDPKTWSANVVDPEALARGDAPSAIPAAQRRAPIGAIRIRVEGVRGPDPLSIARVRLVAEQIHQKTGLTVDITAGSSPHPVTVELPEGKFGQPSLLVREGWSKKGVAVTFLQVLDRKEAALFALILVIAGFFLANGILAAVRTRRSEIGTLRTVGWSPPAIFAVVLGEVALIGTLAGAAGVLLALFVARLASLSLSAASAVLVLPVAVLLALTAGLLPAWQASRGMPLDAVRPPVRAGTRRRRVRGLFSLAFLNAVRVRGRFFVAASGLIVGVAALTLLIAIERGFSGAVVGTVLGNSLSVQVRGADFIAVGITIALAALSVADVLYINLRDRAPEFASLRTVGWNDHQLAVIVALEAVFAGTSGSLAGAAVGVVLGATALDVPVSTLLVAAAVSAVGGTAATVVASLVPLAQLRRATPVAVLADE